MSARRNSFNYGIASMGVLERLATPTLRIFRGWGLVRRGRRRWQTSACSIALAKWSALEHHLGKAIALTTTWLRAVVYRTKDLDKSEPRRRSGVCSGDQEFARPDAGEKESLIQHWVIAQNALNTGCACAMPQVPPSTRGNRRHRRLRTPTPVPTAPPAVHLHRRRRSAMYPTFGIGRHRPSQVVLPTEQTRNL